MIYQESLLEGRCPICEVFTTLTFLTCNHSYCENCLNSYLSIKITEADVRKISCPECPEELSPVEISKFISSDLFKKFQEFKHIKELEQDIFVKWCPMPGCNGYDVASEKNYKLICKECRHQYCYLCSQPWHKSKCKIKRDPVFAKWATQESVRICPRCKTFVQKEGGCPHMTCVKCKYEWCWFCGKEFHAAKHNRLNCLVGRSKFDVFWYMITFCLLFPLAIPFWLLVYLVYRIEISKDFFVEQGKIKRFKYCLYPICFILSPLTFTALVIAPFIICGRVYARLNKCFNVKNKKSYEARCAIYMINVLLALPVIILYPLAIAVLAALGCVFLPPLGVVLLIIKIGYEISKCCRPPVFDYPGSFVD